MLKEEFEDPNHPESLSCRVTRAVNSWRACYILSFLLDILRTTKRLPSLYSFSIQFFVCGVVVFDKYNETDWGWGLEIGCR